MSEKYPQSNQPETPAETALFLEELRSGYGDNRRDEALSQLKSLEGQSIELTYYGRCEIIHIDTEAEGVFLETASGELTSAPLADILRQAQFDTEQGIS